MLSQDLQGSKRLTSLLVFCVSFSVFAQLEWETRLQSLHPSPGKNEVSAVFSFRNAGSMELKIDHIRTTCGCTTADLTKRVYAPGETGELTAILKVTGLKGEVRKQIYVLSKTAGEEPQTFTDELEIVASIPEYLRIEPPSAVWRDAEKMEPKRLTITVDEEFEIHLLKATTSNEMISAELVELKLGKLYELVMTPAVSEPIRSFTTITLESDYPEESPMSFKTFGKIITLKREGASQTLWQRFLKWVAD